MTPYAIDYLADYPDALPEIARWLRREWQVHHGDYSLTEAEAELLEGMNRDCLPLTLVAHAGPRPIGTVTLSAESVENFPTPVEPPCGPWLGGLFVEPEWRGRGVALALIDRAASETRALPGCKHTSLYAGTATVDPLFERAGWRAALQLPWQGVLVTVFEAQL